MKDFSSLLALLSEAFVDWIQAVRNPLVASHAVLTESSSDHERLTKALKLWSTIFVLTLTLQLPVLVLVGIDPMNVAYLAPTSLLFVGALMSGGVTLHIGLVILRLPSKVVDTVVIYSVVFGCYSPLLMLSTLPAIYHNLEVLREVIGQGATFGHAVQAVLTVSATPESSFDAFTLWSILSPINALLSICLLTMVARAIANWYDIDEWSAVRATALSMFVLVIVPVAVLAAAGMFLNYAFLSAS